jgi:hypothetical protein
VVELKNMKLFDKIGLLKLLQKNTQKNKNLRITTFSLQKASFKITTNRFRNPPQYT